MFRPNWPRSLLDFKMTFNLMKLYSRLLVPISLNYEGFLVFYILVETTLKCLKFIA